MVKVTVVQLDGTQIASEWEKLCAYTTAQQPDLLLLPEVPFSSWFFATDDVSETVWAQAETDHAAYIARFGELEVPIVLGTAPTTWDGYQHNTAFRWTAENGVRYVHDKTFLPDEPGFWEATWYDRGSVGFDTVQAGNISVGFMICTELWFMEHARSYGQQGVHIIANPRSVETATTDKWLAGGQVAGVIAGAYCLSSNHCEQLGDLKLGGVGWVTGPDGEVLATTSDENPFVTVEIDLEAANHAKSTYPRYVQD